MADLVIMKDQQAVTTSLQVAEGFDKRHTHVIDAIEAKIHSAENSAQFQNMFAEGTYQDKSGKSNKLYYMNRDGFTFIAMGFTGRKADEFKLKYIDAFNKMENHIKQNLPTTYKEALLQLVEQVEKNEKLEERALVAEQINLELRPKATYYDLVIQNKSLLSVTKIAKDYGMSARKMNSLLHEYGVQFKQGDMWFLYQDYADKGYTQSFTHVIDDENSRMSTKWTQKGRLFIYEIMKQNGYLPLIEQE